MVDSNSEPMQRQWARYHERLLRLEALGVDVAELRWLKWLLDTAALVGERRADEIARLECLSVPEYKLLKPDLATGTLHLAPSIFATTNWHPFRRNERHRLPDSAFEHRTKKELALYSSSPSTDLFDITPPTLPARIPALLTIRIPVNELNQHDLEHVMRLLRAEVKAAIVNRPTSDEAPHMSCTIRPERYDLMMSETFEKDMERFARWVAGDSYDTIARGDTQAKATIAESIRKVCRALGAPTKADRRQIRQRLLRGFECPDHGSDCQAAVMKVIQHEYLCKGSRTRRIRVRRLDFTCLHAERWYQGVRAAYASAQRENMVTERLLATTIPCPKCLAANPVKAKVCKACGANIRSLAA